MSYQECGRHQEPGHPPGYGGQLQFSHRANHVRRWACDLSRTRLRHDDIHNSTFIPANDWVQIVQSAISVDGNGDEQSWPEMWSLDYLRDRRRQAPVAFSFQYQNQVVQTSELSLSPINR